MISFTLRGKEPPYPLDRRIRGPQSRSGHCGGEERKSHDCTCRKFNPGRPVLPRLLL